MASCSSKNHILVFYLVQQNPCALDMAFPTTSPSSRKRVVLAIIIQMFASTQLLNHIIQEFHVPASLNTSAVIFLVLACSLWYITLHRMFLYHAQLRYV